MIRSPIKTALTFLVLLFLCSDVSFADTVVLKSGRTLTGKVTEGKAKKGGDFIILETEAGAVYKLDKGDIVKSIRKLDPVDIDYRKRLRAVSDIATDHINLAKWCEKNGKTRFKEQIRWHYANVIRLDPDHSSARKKLGYFKLSDGTWVAEAEFKSRQGYKKGRKKWISELSDKVKVNNDEFDAKAGARKKEFNLWVRAAERGNVQPAVLADICDNSTILLVYESAVGIEGSVELVRVHLDAISTVKSNTAIRIMSQFAMMHSSKEVREHAITLLSAADMNHAAAIQALAEGLKFSNRAVVLAAAFAIGEIASNNQNVREHAIVPLVNSLNTEHDEAIPGALEAGRLSTSFGTGGTSFRTGGGPLTRKKTFQNQPSLDALRSLFTEARFGFNEQAWLDWYIENYTLADIDVRGDE